MITLSSKPNAYGTFPAEAYETNDTSFTQSTCFEASKGATDSSDVTDVDDDVKTTSLKNFDHCKDADDTAPPERRNDLDLADRVPLIEKSESTGQRYTSCRWVLAYMGAWGSLMVTCLRHCISMAIVCMSELTEDVGGMGLYNDTVEDGTLIVTSEKGAYIPHNMEGVVLSSYFYGYVCTCFLGGVLATKFGFKVVMTVAMTAAATFTLLTPEVIRFSIYCAIGLRISLGFVSGVTIPVLTMMWVSWAPPHEKGKLLTITLSGQSTGAVMAHLISGFLCSIPYDEGWPFIFYVFGAMTLLWVILWQFLSYDTPDKHPRISKAEKAVIGFQQSTAVKVVMPPWRSVGASAPVYGILLAQFADVWFLTFMSIYLPLYFSGFLLFDTELSGAFASLPFVSRLMMGFVFAVMADRILMHRLTSTTRNRKLFQSIGMFGPGLIFLGLGFLDPSQRYVSVALFLVLGGLESAVQVGFRLSALDIAPRFAGPVTGLTATLGSISTIICPLVTSAISADNEQKSWAEVFIITGVICLTGGVAFLLLATAEEQDWAKEKKTPRSDASNDVIP